MAWESVIGLEIHAQLATVSKIFSGAATAYGAEPNTQACAVDLGLPGVLPVLNREAVRMAVKFGLAVEARIEDTSIFARKNYFYPDLPKGYQISQYERPVVGRGHVDIPLSDGGSKRIGITRAHLEEDAGKSLHEAYKDRTAIDLNRAGTPLLEIVSEPDLRSATEAVAYMKKIHTLVRYLGICDGNMQEGSFRCDANISVRRHGTAALGTRTELKNLNSFRFLERAVDFEIERQIDILEAGGTIVQETRLYDPDKHETRSMRQKEEANDYRYFPDPDLLPLVLDAAFIEEIRQTLPELPDAKLRRYLEQMELTPYDAEILAGDPEVAAYFETCVRTCPGQSKLVANWIIGDLTAALNREAVTIDRCPVSAEQLSQLILRIADQTISGKIAKAVFEELWRNGGSVDAIVAEKGLKQVTDSSMIEELVKQVLAENPDQKEQYLSGKSKVMGFFVGEVMKKSGGKANPQQVNQLLQKLLGH